MQAQSFESRSKIEAGIAKKATKNEKKERALKDHQRRIAARNAAEAEAAQVSTLSPQLIKASQTKATHFATPCCKASTVMESGWGC